MSPESAIDPAHAVALAGRATIADKIRYACEQVEPPTTLEVQQWLDTYGVTTARSYASNVIDTWRREHQVGDTGDLVALSPGLLAELDALRTGSSGATSTNGTATTNGSSGTNGTAATNGTPATNGTAGTNGTPATNGTNGSAGTNGVKSASGSNGSKKAKAAAAKAARNGSAKNGSTADGAVVERSDDGVTEPPGVDTLADKDTTENMDTAVESGRADADPAEVEDATQIFGKVDPVKRAAADEDSPTLVTFTPVRDDTDTGSTVEANTVEPDLSWLDEVDEDEAKAKADAKAKDDADAKAAAASVTEAEPEDKVGKDLVVAEAPEPLAEPVTAHAERMAAPVDPEPMPPALPKVPVVLSWSANMAWIVVLIAAMGISWWSLFEYARGFSIPTPLAAVVSLVFDASALIVAGLAHRYALSPYSGAGPRIALLLLLAGSVYLNWEHAAGKGYGIEASIMFAAPAAVGILLFELHIGWHSRSERRARGRVARSLPVIGAWGWFLHPLQSVTTLWRVTHARGRSVRTAELTSIDQSR